MIVIARGGGSVEDLLPFSDETLCRAIAACPTPVVSAVGHEPDNPLCDLVADVRAATPTDAAKRVVPDAAAEQALLAEFRGAVPGAAQLGGPRAARAVAAAQPAGAGRPAEGAHRARRRRPPRPGAVRRDISRLVAAESDGSATWPRGCPRWARRPRWPAAMRWFRRCPPQAGVAIDGDAPAGTRLRVRVADGAVTAVSEGTE